MMKKDYNLIFNFILLPIFMFAQNPIQNAGFEDWSADEPDNWFSNNIPGTVTVITQSSTAHGGSYAVKGENGEISPGVLWPASITAGTSSEDLYIPVTQKYAKLSGYYQLHTSGTDFIGVMATLLDASKTGRVASIAESISDTTSEYTYFSFDFDYTGGNGENAAFLELQFTMSMGVANQIGSYFLLDDVEVSGVTAIESEYGLTPSSFRLEQNYPNPFNPSTTFEFILPNSTDVQLLIYNQIGQKVASVVNDRLSAGIHQVNWSSGELPAGVYYYRLFTDNFSATKKLIILK